MQSGVWSSWRNNLSHPYDMRLPSRRGFRRSKRAWQSWRHIGLGTWSSALCHPSFFSFFSFYFSVIQCLSSFLYFPLYLALGVLFSWLHSSISKYKETQLSHIFEKKERGGTWPWWVGIPISRIRYISNKDMWGLWPQYVSLGFRE